MIRKAGGNIRARLNARPNPTAPPGPWGAPAPLPAGVPLILDARHHPTVFGPTERRWWLLTPDDKLTAVEPVFWSGDGTANLYTGSRSLRNYRRADTGQMALAEDVPRVHRPEHDEHRYTLTAPDELAPVGART